MAKVRLEDVSKVYKGGVKAVSGFSLDIKDKEFVVFVGPSGCGKSTTLRMIAGLESITSGNLYIGDKYMNDVEPKDRNIAMVFQNYALYPNLSVYENIAYPLRCRKMGKSEIESRVGDAAKILGIEDYLKRKPKELSGGQRQRVALGRAIVRQPDVFLLDEPLSNLDAKLRVQMRSEISKLHERLGTTFIYVTHDQTEAMTMGDRIVVMKEGLIQQVDSPEALYGHPSNSFVATFLGSPQMNLFAGNIKEEKGQVQFFSKGTHPFSCPLDPFLQERLKGREESLDVTLGIRPSSIKIGPRGTGLFDSSVELVEHLGEQSYVYFKGEGREEDAIALLNTESPLHNGAPIGVDFDRSKLHFFNRKSGESLALAPDFVTLDNEGYRYVSEDEMPLLSARLLDKSLGSYHVGLRFPSSALSLWETDKEKSLSLQIRIDCEKGGNGLKRFFAREVLSKTPLEFSSPSLAASIGETIKVFVPFSLLDLVDLRSGEKLTDSMPFSSTLHLGEVTLRHHSYFLEGKGERVNHEKAYRLLRMNKLGERTLLLLKGAEKKEELYYSVPSFDLLFLGMLIQFDHQAKKKAD